MVTVDSSHDRNHGVRVFALKAVLYDGECTAIMLLEQLSYPILLLQLTCLEL